MDCSPPGSSCLWNSPGKNAAAAAAAAKLLQSCPTLCNPIDGSLPGSPIPGILQVRVLEQGAIAFSEKYWSGQLFLSPGNLPNPGIEPRSSTLQADFLLFEPPGKPKNHLRSLSIIKILNCNCSPTKLESQTLWPGKPYLEKVSSGASYQQGSWTMPSPLILRIK